MLVGLAAINSNRRSPFQRLSHLQRPCAGSDDNYTVVPGSQFTVTRTAQKDNTSKYYVNSRLASFSEVTSLLKGKGIDLDNNRFLILQGEVELISQMKPKAQVSIASHAGVTLSCANMSCSCILRTLASYVVARLEARLSPLVSQPSLTPPVAPRLPAPHRLQTPHEEGLLEYLEDIIGSNVYVEQIEQASAVLEQLSEQRNEKIKRVQIAEKEKAGLEGSKAEAEALMSKEREYERKKGALVQKSLSQNSHVVAALQGHRAEAASKLEAERANVAGITSRLSAAESGFQAATTAFQSASDAANAVKAELTAIEHEDVKLREQVKFARQRVKQNEEGIQREKQKLEEATKITVDSNARLPGLEAAVTRLTAEKAKEEADHDAVMATLKGETDVIRRKLDAKQVELTPAADASAAADSKLETAKTQLRLMKESVEAASTQQADLKKKHANLSTDLQNKSVEAAALQAELDKGGVRRQAAEQELQLAAAAEAAASEKLKAASARLAEGRASHSADSSRSTLVQSLMDATKKGGALATAGLHGRLGDLGRIEDKYDVAVTTACGALNWLVVETTEGGQKCLDFLRAKNLGRAKFIILDKMSSWAVEMAKPKSAPEGVPRLFDLIQSSDPKYRSAFYFAVRDTLVAKDMDQATRVAFGTGKDGHRWRVVTVDGGMIETTGAMSGGGAAPRKGGMRGAPLRPSVSSEEMAAWESEAASAKDAAEAARKRRTDLTKEVTDWDKNAPKISQRIQKLRLEIAGIRSIIDDLAGQIASAAGSASAGPSAADASAIAELQSQVASLQADATAKHDIAVRIEGEVSALKRQVVEVGGEKVARAKARLDRANEALDKAISDVSKARSDLKAAQKASEKATEAAAKCSAEAAAALEEYEALRQQMPKLEDKALVIVEKSKAAIAEAAAREADVVSLRSELDTITREARVLKEREAEYSRAVSELDAEIAVNLQKVAELQRRFETVAADYQKHMDDYVAELTSAASEAGELDDDADGTGASESGSRKQSSGGGVSESKGDDSMDGGDDAAGSSKGIHPIVRARINEPLTLPVLTDDQLAALTEEVLSAALAIVKAEREELSKKVDLRAIKEYRLKEKEYLRRVAELEAVARAREEARKSFEGLRRKRLDTFMAGFRFVSRCGMGEVVRCVGGIYVLPRIRAAYTHTSPRDFLAVAPYPLQRHHSAPQGDVPDDHAGRRC